MPVELMSSAKEEVERLCDEYVAAFERGDVAGCVADVAEDARLMLPHRDFIAGRDAIADAYRRLFDSGVSKTRLEILETDGEGRFLYTVGRYSFLTESGNVTDEGKFVLVWKQVNGEWMIIVDCSMTSLPMT